MKFHLALAGLALFSLLAVDAVDHGRSLKQVEVFKVEIGDKLPDNFLISSSQQQCVCTCGQFAAEVLRDQTECIPAFFGFLVDVNDDDFFLTSWDGTGGSNFLTSNSDLPLCPGTVTFDYRFAFTGFYGDSFIEPFALTLEVIDTSAMNKVVFAEGIPNATVAIDDPDLVPNQETRITRFGSENITLGGVGFKACAENLKLRFNWNNGNRSTSTDQADQDLFTEFLLDNIAVTPDPDAVSSRLESKQDACKTTVAPIDQSFLSSIQNSHPVPSDTLSAQQLIIFQQGPCGGGCNGDPHFTTWRGQHFDFMGECDLVLLHNADFESSGVSLDVHIRTKIRRDMSYISDAALRIGQDLLEVASQGVYWFNGVLNADLPEEFSGFAFSHTQPTDQQHVFEVYLGGRERIKVKTYKDFVSVLIEQGKSEHFLGSDGLMGDFAMGRMIARDGKTIIDDANAFGQEWQVRDTEPSLFQTLRLPQHPNVCILPTPKQTSQLRRRLAATSLDEQLAAEKACEHWGEGKDDCVFDVLSTGDLEMAEASVY
jgi:hypothetical protein